MTKLNESVVSGDIAGYAPPMGHVDSLGISPLAYSPLAGNSLIPTAPLMPAVQINSIVDNTYQAKLNTPIEYLTINADGNIFGHVDPPVFSSIDFKWSSTSPKIIGNVTFANPAANVVIASSSKITLSRWNGTNIRETLMASGLFTSVALVNEQVAPNYGMTESSLNEGAHYRSIYFNKFIGEREIPSIYRFATIDDDGTVSIFTNKPLYQTTGKWTGKGQHSIAKAVFSENYAFPIYASNLIIKLFGQSRLDEVATPVMVKDWIIHEDALEKVWDEYDFRINSGDLHNNLFNSGIQSVPGVGDVSQAIVEGVNARTQVVNFGNKDSGVPSDYEWAAINDSGDIQLFKSEPRYVNGLWKGKGRFTIGYVQFYPEVTVFDIQDMYWKISNIKASKFLSYRNHIIKRIYVDGKSLNDIWSLSEGKMNEASIKLQGDTIDLPDGYTHVAVDVNTDICVFKAEPKLKNGIWKGKGKTQIGVAVWNFSKLEGNPTSMTEAKPKILEFIGEMKYELKDGFNLQKELKNTGKFKYFFGKYSEIEKL